MPQMQLEEAVRLVGEAAENPPADIDPLSQALATVLTRNALLGGVDFSRLRIVDESEV